MNIKGTTAHGLLISSRYVITLYNRMGEKYMGAHGIAAEKLRVSKNVFDRTKDRTLLGRCCAKSWARKPPSDVP